MAGSPHVSSVDEVIVAPLATLTVPDPARLNEAYLALSATLSSQPSNAVQRLVDTAMQLTGAGSAGISLEDTEGGEEVFRWVAAAGEFGRYRNGTMPRHFSPCGTVVDRHKTLLMRDPARFFPYAADLQPHIHEALLVPFSRKGRAVGTVWVLSHRPDKRFTVEDVRGVESLTTFATSILDAVRPR